MFNEEFKAQLEKTTKIVELAREAAVWASRYWSYWDMPEELRALVNAFDLRDKA